MSCRQKLLAVRKGFIPICSMHSYLQDALDKDLEIPHESASIVYNQQTHTSFDRLFIWKICYTLHQYFEVALCNWNILSDRKSRCLEC